MSVPDDSITNRKIASMLDEKKIREEDIVIEFSITEKMRCQLQSGIIAQHGLLFDCEKCGKKFHILDLVEYPASYNDVPTLRYLCPDDNTIIIEATAK